MGRSVSELNVKLETEFYVLEEITSNLSGISTDKFKCK